MINQQKLNELVRQLPPELQQEVEDFTLFLIAKHSPNPKPLKKLSQNWAGALSEYKNKFTSLELQKQSLEWRGD